PLPAERVGRERRAEGIDMRGLGPVVADLLEDRDAARLATGYIQLLENLDHKAALKQFMRRAKTCYATAENDDLLRHDASPTGSRKRGNAWRRGRIRPDTVRG